MINLFIEMSNLYSYWGSGKMNHMCKTRARRVVASLSGLFVVVSVILAAEDVFPGWPEQIYYLIGFIVFACTMGWWVIDKQRIIDERENRIRLAARIGQLSINFPEHNEKPLGVDEASIKATVYFEIWADMDVHTANLALNVVGISRRRWGRLFRTSKRLFGIPMEGHYDTVYRRQIKVADAQPFEEHATFKWRGKREMVEWGDSFLLELALKTGSPVGICRVIIDPKLYERGVDTPL